MSQFAKEPLSRVVANILSAHEHRQACPGSLQVPSGGERIGPAL